MLDKNTLYKNLNEGLMEERHKVLKSNLKKNLNSIKAFGGLKNILHLFDNKNIIVIGAGPSLEQNYNLLKKYQNRSEFVFVSTDISLLPLMKNGIKPAFVFSCETNPVDFFSNIDTKNIHLVAFSCVSNINLRKWQGSVSFYNWMLDNDFYNELWEMAGKDLGFVATASIVTTQVISFALGCNVKSIVLVGNDLGFSNKYYVNGVSSYFKHLHNSSRLNNINSFDMRFIRRKREYEIIRGDKTFYSNSQFLAAKLWLEDLFTHQKISIYDCSIPGCSEKNVIKIELKNFFSQFDRKKRRK